MTKRKVYHLLWSAGRWQLRLGRHVISRDGIKYRLLRFARTYVGSMANRPSQLIVRTRDGKFQFEHTYGADPRRYKG